MIAMTNTNDNKEFSYLNDENTYHEIWNVFQKKCFKFEKLCLKAKKGQREKTESEEEADLFLQ